MDGLLPSLRVILIGGASHTGKSTLARPLASALGWEYRATDKLAKHPGRPWRNDGTHVPPHVVEHYATLSVDDLVADVLRHYERNVLPQIDALVRAHASDPSSAGLVLEGSALWPEIVAPLVSDKVAALWLTASDNLLMKRIYAESHYAEKSPQEQLLIRKFLERTLVYGGRMERAVSEHRLLSVRVRPSDTAETLVRRCVKAIASDCSGT